MQLKMLSSLSATLILLTGCSSIGTREDIDRHLGAQVKANYATVDVYFGTDRKPLPEPGSTSRYGPERGQSIQYGSVKVSIPRDHRMGELESPSIWKLEFKADPEKHVIVLDIKAMEASSYYRALSQAVRSAPTRSAFIFVHGYNTSFNDAARRTAQLSYDLGFRGAPVFYSWPSQGNPAKYPFDENNVEWSTGNLERFLLGFAENSDAENIYLIAHSMGTRALTEAYASLIQKNPAWKSRFKEIILAAPDIDAEIFKQRIAPAMAQGGIPITLYASSKDEALQYSKKFHGLPRAGDSGQAIVIVPGVESIDSSNVETDFLGHSYYAEGVSVISDIFDLVHKRLRPRDRSRLMGVTAPTGRYWQFKPAPGR